MTSSHIEHRDEVRTVTTGNAITWPFHQEHWFKSLWIPLLWWFFIPPVILPIGVLPALGWMLDAIARRGRQDAKLLPESRNILQMFGKGIVFLLALGVFFVIPAILFSVLYAVNEANANATAAHTIQDYIQLGYSFAGHLVFGTPASDIAVLNERVEAFARQQELRYVLFVLSVPVYLVLAVPLFVAGAIRYALTGRASGFFNIFGNLLIVVEHLIGFLKVLFVYAVLVVAITVLSIWFAYTLVLPAIFAASSFWIMAHVAGKLAARIWTGSARIREAAQSPPRG